MSRAAETEPGGIDLGEVGAIEVGVEPTPTPENFTYTNEAYGFSFVYPETWTLTEEDHGVILQKGTNRLGINFRWADEPVEHFGRTGMGAGDFIYAGKISFLNQVIPVEKLFFEKKSKAVFYGESGPIEIGDLVFMIALEDLESDYLNVDLPEEIITEANRILESFKRIETATGIETSVGSSGLPVRRTTEEAGEMIATYLMEHNPGMMEAPFLTFEEMLDEKVWETLQAQSKLLCQRMA